MVPAVSPAWNRRLQGLEPLSPGFGTVVSRVWNHRLQGLEPSYPLRGTALTPRKDCAKIRKPPENTFLFIPFIRNINTFAACNS